MSSRLLVPLLLLVSAVATRAGLDLPRIGCWNEPAADGPARVLFGIAGNLVVRPAGEEGCANRATFGEPDEAGVRTLPIGAQWQLAESAEGERYLIYRSTVRYELPQ